jgi:hypothetical protein
VSANIYYDPEKFGLTVIGAIELGGGWEYDTTVLWKDAQGFAWAHDAGCSCPTPFEDINLTNVSRGSLEEFASYARAKQIHDYTNEREVNDFDRQLQDLVAKAKRP